MAKPLTAEEIAALEAALVQRQIAAGALAPDGTPQHLKRCPGVSATAGQHEWITFTLHDPVRYYRGVGAECVWCHEKHELSEEAVIAWLLRHPTTQAAHIAPQVAEVRAERTR